MLFRSHKDSKITILSITHDIDEVVSSDNVLVMSKGQVVMQGTPEEIFSKERQLKDIRLDIPFSLKLAHALQQRGLNVSNQIKMEGLVEEICQLSSRT